jgi:cyclopropane fatty-acyl-phospholipid synthase-like methyltransferase
MTKPFSQACENNRGPILEILKPLLADKNAVLEIGSGTGQHAVWFAKHLPHLIWQTSDVLENHWCINQWLDAFPSHNLPPPLTLDVLCHNFSMEHYDAIFSANTAHIMPWRGVVNMFSTLAAQLPSHGVFCLYGPMGYRGTISPESNRQFDLSLRQQSAQRGIRQFEDINDLAIDAGLELLSDQDMPANNHLLAWRKK